MSTEDTWRQLEADYYEAATDAECPIRHLYDRAMAIAALAAGAWKDAAHQGYSPRWGVVYRDWLGIATQHALQAQALGREEV